MKSRFNESLQWVGAFFIIIGHVLNAVGPSTHPYNIVAFTIGTVFFLSWTILVNNKPQLIVNVVAITTCVGGLIKAYFG